MDDDIFELASGQATARGLSLGKIVSKIALFCCKVDLSSRATQDGFESDHMGHDFDVTV